MVDGVPSRPDPEGKGDIDLGVSGPPALSIGVLGVAALNVDEGVVPFCVTNVGGSEGGKKGVRSTHVYSR